VAIKPANACPSVRWLGGAMAPLKKKDLLGRVGAVRTFACLFIPKRLAPVKKNIRGAITSKTETRSRPINERD
jgi:hypothetical protein